METLETTWKTPLRWPGGKSKVAAQLLAQFPKRISEYREPFVGGGSVFFAVRSADKAESYWINDKYQHLYCFWKMMKKRRDKLQAVVQDMHNDCSKDIDSLRSLFNEAKNTKVLSEFEAACFLFVLNRISFSGTVMSGGFSKVSAVDRFTQSSIDRLTGIEDALAGVKITNLDYSALLSPGPRNTFLFLDPPYPSEDKKGQLKLYGVNGDLQQINHAELAGMLQRTTHKFMLTYSDHPDIRDLYKWADIQEFQIPYSMKTNIRERKTELLIRNY